MKRVKKPSQMLLFTCMAIYLSGCVTGKIPGADPLLFVSLEIGKTVRQDVILKFGEPSQTYEDQHILTYKVGHDKSQGFYILGPGPFPWVDAKGKTRTNARYSLVLVFGDDGVLKKQNLVRVL